MQYEHTKGWLVEARKEEEAVEKTSATERSDYYRLEFQGSRGVTQG